MGMTIAEKIIARAAGVESVRPGDIHTVEVDRLMSNDGTTHLTIDMYNTGQSKGFQESFNMNYQKLGKDLASVDELAVLDGGKCILQLRGVRPFLSDKYDITKHPNYKYLSDADPKNNFDIEKFLSTRLKTKPEDTFDTYEISDTADSDYSE